MSSNVEQRRNLLDAPLSEHNRRERRQLLRSCVCYAAISLASAWEASHQSLTRQVVSCPEWWFAWVVFGVPSLVFFVFALSRFMLAHSLGNFPGWNDNIIARLPPSVAKLMGLPSREALRRNRGFALGGGVLFGRGGSRGRDEMAVTTPEVLRSTTSTYRDSLKSRSAARNGATPQRLRLGGDSREETPGSKTPDGRRLFSPVDTFGAFSKPVRRLTPLETAKAGRRALSIRPQDVGKMVKECNERHAKAEPAPQQEGSSTSQIPLSLLSYTAPQTQSVGFPQDAGGGMGEGMRGYYPHDQTRDAGVLGADVSTMPYQVYVPADAEVTSRRKGEDPERDSAKQLLMRLGIAEKADDVTTNVKTYVVRLMRNFLGQFDEVCSLLHARGVAEELLVQQLHRQPQLKLKNTPRVFFNLSLKDMGAQFGQLADFWVKGPDGNPMNLFQKYQHLEEALQVTAGSGVAGVGNPAYVLERLRVLAEDDFMSAFDYDRGGGYPAGREWSDELPTDAAVVMRLFVCCSDDLLPRQWETDRPFARQHLVDRQPLKSDALLGRFFLTRNEALHPPYFFVVANQEVWHALPGHSNVFQAIALFFYSIKTHKSGYLGTGISVTSIVREIFGS